MKVVESVERDRWWFACWDGVLRSFLRSFMLDLFGCLWVLFVELCDEVWSVDVVMFFPRIVGVRVAAPLYQILEHFISSVSSGIFVTQT